MKDFSKFLDVQIKTAWGRVLVEFASFCTPSTSSGQSPEPASPILDIGCGPGLLPAIFAQRGCKVFGVDYDFALLVSGLVPSLAQADALALPFRPATFDLITATNVLFLLADPLAALQKWTRVLAPNGELCLLNPSENLNIATATDLANARGIGGTSRESLLFWAHNAETYFCWTEAETQELLEQAGLRLEESLLKVGPGFARFVRAKLY